jgi:hypothetical protein
MRIIHRPGSIKKFHRTPLRFQTTFQTPLKDLESFVDTILGSLGSVESGTVTIDDTVMGAERFRVFLRTAELPHDSTVIADTADETHRLLVAALDDWVDFFFVPSPRPFVLYADHDENATFFANTRSNLNKVASALETKGFKRVKDYVR